MLQMPLNASNASPKTLQKLHMSERQSVSAVLYVEPQLGPGLPLPRVTCHMSPVPSHLSPITCHIPPVICHLSPVTKPTATATDRKIIFTLTV